MRHHLSRILLCLHLCLPQWSWVPFWCTPVITRFFFVHKLCRIIQDEHCCCSIGFGETNGLEYYKSDRCWAPWCCSISCVCGQVYIGTKDMLQKRSNMQLMDLLGAQECLRFLKEVEENSNEIWNLYMETCILEWI